MLISAVSQCYSSVATEQKVKETVNSGNSFQPNSQSSLTVYLINVARVENLLLYICHSVFCKMALIPTGKFADECMKK